MNYEIVKFFILNMILRMFYTKYWINGCFDWINSELFSITGINYIFKYIQIKIGQIKNSQYYCLDYFQSNKCSLGEHKRLLSKT